MNLYCERAYFDTNTKAYEIVFDFNSISDLEELEGFLGSGSTNESSKTLIILSNVKVKSYKGPRAGSWYKIPIAFFDNFIEVDTEPESSLVRFYLTKSKGNHKTLNFQQYKTIDSNLFNENEETMEFSNSRFFDFIKGSGCVKNLELVVRDVGCGNWNEVKGEGFHLIYDLGGDLKFSDIEMGCIISRANLTGPYYAVISHWDLDHYRAILDLDDVQLGLMQNIVVPSKMPSTLRLNEALNRLQSLGINIDIISPSPRRGRGIELISQGKLNFLELFRSNDGANINQSGIVLTIEGTRKIGVLTGDHHYPQIYRGVLNRVVKKPYEFVVPHHGGNAGKFDESLWNTISFASGALSTKSFRYRNLPQTKIHNYFIKQQFFHCTECQNYDYSTML